MPGTLCWGQDTGVMTVRLVQQASVAAGRFAVAAVAVGGAELMVFEREANGAGEVQGQRVDQYSWADAYALNIRAAV